MLLNIFLWILVFFYGSQKWKKNGSMNTVLRKTCLKVQIRLPPIKVWLIINQLSDTYSASYLDALYANKNFDLLNQLHGMTPLNKLSFVFHLKSKTNLVTLRKCNSHLKYYKIDSSFSIKWKCEFYKKFS